jgi:hypothetical protein
MLVVSLKSVIYFLKYFSDFLMGMLLWLIESRCGQRNAGNSLGFCSFGKTPAQFNSEVYVFTSVLYPAFL